MPKPYVCPNCGSPLIVGQRYWVKYYLTPRGKRGKVHSRDESGDSGSLWIYCSNSSCDFGADIHHTDDALSEVRAYLEGRMAERET